MAYPKHEGSVMLRGRRRRKSDGPADIGDLRAKTKKRTGRFLEEDQHDEYGMGERWRGVSMRENMESMRGARGLGLGLGHNDLSGDQTS